MKNFFRQSDILPSAAAGVHAHLEADNFIRWSIVIVERNGKKVLIKEKNKDISTENLLSALKGDLPVALTITGKGIIHKEITIAPDDTDESVLQKVFPGAAHSEFYLQRYAVKKNPGRYFVSVLRRDLWKTVISPLSGKKIVKAAAGPFSCELLFSFTDVAGIIVDGFTIERNVQHADFIPGGNKNEREEYIKIGEEEVSTELVMSLAGALSFFVNRKDAAELKIADVALQSDEFREQLKFRRNTATAMIAFLAALLINFMLFTFYQSKNEALTSTYIRSKNLVSEVSERKQATDSLFLFLEKNGLLQLYRPSFFADRLAAGLPKGVQLTTLKIFPQIKSLHEDKEDIRFRQRFITVNGLAGNSALLNDWINILRKEKFAAAVNLVHYGQNISEKGSFELSIELH